MNKNDSWKILIGYSSIATKLVILLIFLEDLINAQYLSSILIIFLFLSSGGTIIAAYFLGAKE
jgi:NADH-quinone oxidoreductase subunit J